MHIDLRSAGLNLSTAPDSVFSLCSTIDINSQRLYFDNESKYSQCLIEILQNQRVEIRQNQQGPMPDRPQLYDEVNEYECDIYDSDEPIAEAPVVRVASDVEIPAFSYDDTKGRLANYISSIPEGLSHSIISQKNVVDRLFDRLVLENEKLREMTAHVDENVELSNIMRQIQELIDDDNIVTNVYVGDNNELDVYTDTIVTNIGTEDSVQYCVGKMKISIKLGVLLNGGGRLGFDDQIATSVKLTNLSPIIDNNGRSLACGHCKNGHSPCWGSALPQVYAAIADKNLTALVNVIVTFIRTPDINDSWGSYILQFPEHIS